MHAAAEKRIKMITKQINISDGVRISYIETDKFKTNYFSFNFIAPLSRIQILII